MCTLLSSQGSDAPRFQSHDLRPEATSLPYIFRPVPQIRVSALSGDGLLHRREDVCIVFRLADGFSEEFFTSARRDIRQLRRRSFPASPAPLRRQGITLRRCFGGRKPLRIPGVSPPLPRFSGPGTAKGRTGDAGTALLERSGQLTSSSTQSKVFVTAFFQLRSRRSRSASSSFGSQRRSSCQLPRRSSRFSQTPTARPAA